MIPRHLQSLFWDTNSETFDAEVYPAYAIERVLEHGNQEAVAWLRRTFSEDQIRDVLRTNRRLTLRSANFWALIFGVSTQDVAALQSAH